MLTFHVYQDKLVAVIVRGIFEKKRGLIIWGTNFLIFFVNSLIIKDGVNY